MELLSFFIPTVIMVTPIVILLIFLRHRAQQTQARYRTLLALADKGVELSHDLLAQAQNPDADRRRALVLIGGAAGVMAMVVALPLELHDGTRISSFWGIGLLPLMTGFGYLASWWLNRRDTRLG